MSCSLSALWEQVWIISTSSSSFQILIPYIINVKRSTKMQPENLGREGSPSIMEVSLWFCFHFTIWKISPGWWDLKTWPLFLFITYCWAFLNLPGAVPWWRMEREEAAQLGRDDGVFQKPPCSTQVVVWPLPGHHAWGHGDCAGRAECRPTWGVVYTWTISDPALLGRENNLFYG